MQKIKRKTSVKLIFLIFPHLSEHHEYKIGNRIWYYDPINISICFALGSAEAQGPTLIQAKVRFSLFTLLKKCIFCFNLIMPIDVVHEMTYS